MSLNQTEIKKIRKSGIIATLVLLTIATSHMLRGHNSFAIAFYLLAGIFFTMSGFFPAVFKRITGAIGFSLTALILSAVFYIVITPMGLIMRLFGRDTLDKKIDKKRNSYWEKKEVSGEDIAGYERQF